MLQAEDGLIADEGLTEELDRTAAEHWPAQGRGHRRRRREVLAKEGLEARAEGGALACRPPPPARRVTPAPPSHYKARFPPQLAGFATPGTANFPLPGFAAPTPAAAPPRRPPRRRGRGAAAAAAPAAAQRAPPPRPAGVAAADGCPGGRGAAPRRGGGGGGGSGVGGGGSADGGGGGGAPAEAVEALAEGHAGGALSDQRALPSIPPTTRCSHSTKRSRRWRQRRRRRA